MGDSSRNYRWPVPDNEAMRLEDLMSLDMVGTPAEEPFDSIVEVLATLFEVPAAALTFVDAELQWVKASVGIPVSSMSRAHAFCAHTIMGTQTLVVEDMTRDWRFQDHPFVTDGPRLRFYAGAPLVSNRRLCVGTLCVLDTKPRSFTLEQLRLLERMAAVAMDALETRRLVRKIADASHYLAASI